MRYWWRVIGAGLLTRALNSLTSSGGLDVTYESLKLTTKVRGLLDARGSSLSGGCDSGGSGGSGVHVHFPVFSAVVAEEVAAEANAQELAHAGDVDTAAEVASGGRRVVDAHQRQVRTLPHYHSQGDPARKDELGAC